MKLFIRGKGEVELNTTDFVAQGGEGAVYARGDLAFKVYTDPGKMIPTAKIQELSALILPNIIRPQDVLLDARNRPVGYTMRRVQNAITLCQLFPRAFRERNGLTPDDILDLVRKLREGVQHVHDRGMLVVDLNEMNFLVDLTAREMLFIDVDSYQTPGFKPTALADSVRDRHATRFSPNTDWFSFGIISFQMFLGIHPYRGKDAAGRDMETRMQQNISVFHSGVSLPKACYPFQVIPQAYLEWYRALFEEGKRAAPPDSLHSVMTRMVASSSSSALSSGERVEIKELHRFPANIVFPIVTGLNYGAVTTRGVSLGSRCYPLRPDVVISTTPRQNQVIAAWQEGQTIHFFNLTQGCPLSAAIEGEALTASEARLYVKNGTALYEVQFLELPAGIQVAVHPVTNVLANATRLFDGVAFQNLLGACYAAVFPQPKTCYNLRLPELDSYRIVNARFENRVLIVVGEKNGVYVKFLCRFDADYRAYDLRIIPALPHTDIHFAVLDNGICVHVNAEEALELFSNARGSQSLRVIADPALQDARLFKNGVQLLCVKDNTLYSLSLKP